MIDRASIDDMSRLMRILSEGGSVPVADIKPASVAEKTQPARPKGDPDVDAMRVILERLQSASTTVVEHLVETGEKDKVLGEALTTNRTETGARIGNWEIRLHEEGREKRYDVVNTATNEPIAKDLYLYEAAYGLTKHLNQGLTINDRRVKNMMQIEEDFVRHRNDAVSMKRRKERLIREGNSQAALVAEDRYDEAKRQAIHARQRLKEMTGIR